LRTWSSRKSWGRVKDAFDGAKSIMQALENAVIDASLRNRLVAVAEEALTLLPGQSREENGTSNRIGSFEYHNFNNGLSGTSSQIGNSTYTNYNNGTTCISNKVGTYTYTNCN
jgi:hypothetical protein